MKIAVVSALLWAIAAPAWSAPVTIGMTFLNPAGAEVGSGSFSYDPSATVDLYFDGTQFCAPSPADPACAIAATWTPLTDFQWSVYGVTFGAPIGALFVEGFLEFEGRGSVDAIFPGSGWLFGDAQTGEGLSIMSADFSTPGTWDLGSYQLFDLDPIRFSNAGASGSVLFTPVEVPLPPAGLLFVASLMGVGALRRHRAAASSPLDGGRVSAASLRIAAAYSSRILKFRVRSASRSRRACS